MTLAEWRFAADTAAAAAMIVGGFLLLWRDGSDFPLGWVAIALGLLMLQN